MRARALFMRRAGGGALAALTVTAATISLAAGPAAAVTVTGAAAVPVPSGNPPAVEVAGMTNQPGQNITFTVTAGTVVPGDTVTLTADDSDGGNCLTTGDTVGFHTVPTVTDTTGSGVAATPTVALASTTSCGSLVGGPYRDQVVITFHNSVSTNRTFTVSGLTYDLGNRVKPGPLNVRVSAETPPAPPGTGPSTTVQDGTIVAVTVTGDNPATGIPPASSNQAISPVVITETEPGQVAGFVCLAITSPTGSNGPTFSQSATPSVATNGNGSQVDSGQPGAVPGSTAPTTYNPPGATAPTQLFFHVATPSSGATNGATFTVSGIKLDTRTDTGPVMVTVGQGTTVADACAAAADPSGATTGPDGTGTVLGTTTATAIIGVSRIFGADRYGTAAAILATKGDEASSFQAADECNSKPFAVVLSRGDLYPDALAGSYLAGSLNRTGILLTRPEALPDITVSAIRNLGVTDIFITGGFDAVSKAVEDQLKATPSYNCGGASQRLTANGTPQTLKVTRIGGATRYDTAQLLAQSPDPTLIGTSDLDGDTTPNAVRTAIVATGQNFPDALAAGPLAYGGSNICKTGGGAAKAEGPVFGTGVNCESPDPNSPISFVDGEPEHTGDLQTNGFPLLLTATAGLSPQAQSGLLNLGIKSVIIPGGTNAVSASTEAAIQALGITTKRVGGADRTETAAKLATFATDTYSDLPAGLNGACNTPDEGPPPNTCTIPSGLGYNTDHINIARGDDFADALVGAPHASEVDDSTPILLTPSPATLGTQAHDYLVAHSVPKVNSNDAGPTPNGGIIGVDIFGGPFAISNATAAEVQNALTGA